MTHKERLYHTGMQLADCLRLLGKHEESAQIERWVLAMVKEIEAKSNKVRRKK